MRSVLRWLRRLATGVLLLAAVVIAVALVAAHTDWGREQLRAHIEAALQAEFPGGAHVRAVEGSILGTLTLRDVKLDRRDRTPQVTIAIGKLDADVALWPLVIQTAQIDKLVADDVHVCVHDRPPPSALAPGAASARSPWRIEVPHVEIHRASIEIEAGGLAQTFADLDIAGSVTIAPTGTTTMFGWAHGQWSRSGATPALTAVCPPPAVPAPPSVPGSAATAELTATATVVLDGGVHVPTALIALAGTTQAPGGDDSPSGLATISATDLLIDADHPSGKVRVSVPARAVATLIPELEQAGVAPGQLGDVVAAIDVAPEPPTATRVEVNAAAGETTLWASLQGELATQVKGKISAHAVDLALLTRGRVGGRGELFAKYTGRPVDGKGYRFDLSQIVATAPAVDVLGQRVTGTLVVNAKATGTLAPALAMDVTGNAAGNQIAVTSLERTAMGRFAEVTGVEIATVKGPFQLRITPGTPLGEAHVTATGIRNAGTWLGSAHADLENHADGTFSVAATAWPPTKGLEIAANALVTAGETGKPTIATLDRTRVTLPNRMSWTGRGGSVVLTDAKVAMRGVTLHNGDAKVALRGDLARSTGMFEAHVDGDGFPASAIDARYRGRGSATLELTRRGGIWNADGTFKVSSFATAAEDSPIDGTAHVVLADGRVTLDANATLDADATGPEHNRAELVFEAVAPRDPFDLHAWRMLDRGAVRNATITAHQVALSAVAGMVEPAASGRPLTGTIDGVVNFAPSDLHGSFALRDVKLPFPEISGDATGAPHEGQLGEVDGNVMFAPSEGDLGATGTLTLSGIAETERILLCEVALSNTDPPRPPT
jgi:hypothetical protein